LFASYLFILAIITL